MGAPADGLCLVGGEWVRGGEPAAVLDKYTQETFATASLATEALTDRALDVARGYAPPSQYVRAETLLAVHGVVAAREAEFVELMQAEAGFTRADALGEHARCQQTLTLASEAARHIHGETVPFDGARGGGAREGQVRTGYTVRVPRGVVLAITPFNSPLNTVCHKIAPGFASGNATVLKPSLKTPLTANLLAACFLEGGVPEAALSVLHGDRVEAERLIDDSRVDFIAFTGSTAVGRSIQGRAGLRKTQMELGAISPTFVCPDADLADAATKCAGASFRKAGQVCTSIQNLFVHADVADDFRARFVEAASELRSGDPRDAATRIGPLIGLEARDRVRGLIDDAVEQGATATELAAVEGAANLAPTLLEGTTDAMRIRSEEAFGPVVALRPYTDEAAAIAAANATPFGLSAGVFTQDISRAHRFARELRMGGVHINQTSSCRVDLMPYGGVKNSGFGNEGPAFAVDEMMETRLVSFTVGT